MTWHFDPSNETVDLYDPAGTLVAEAVPFSGSWSDYPKQELRDEVAAHLVEIGQQDTDKAILWAFEWLSGDAQEGTPDTE